MSSNIRREVCFDVIIRDDDSIEKDEVFELHIIRFEDGVNVPISYIEVHIHDDDCKWFSNCASILSFPRSDWEWGAAF